MSPSNPEITLACKFSGFQAHFFGRCALSVGAIPPLCQIASNRGSDAILAEPDLRGTDDTSLKPQRSHGRH